MVEGLRRQHLHGPTTQKLRELALDADEVQAGNVARLKLHQDVDVAVGSKIVAKYRPEQNQSHDVMSSAECRDGVTIDRDA